MNQQHSLIRTIYLYLFTLVGLALLISGTVRFIDMGLKIFIFTQADLPEKVQQRYYYPTIPFSVEKLGEYQDDEDLTGKEKETLKSFLKGYEEWQEEEAKIDYLASTRQRESSSNLAMLLVGLPLYFYHWGIIKRELRQKVENKS